MDVGTAPVVFLRGIGDAPGAGLAVPVGVQGEVDAPGRQQEGKDLGGGAHGLVPVIVPLALDGLVEVAGIQPFLGILDPVHDLGVHLDGGLTGSHPRLRDAVAVQAEGVGVGSEGVVALGFQFLGGGLQGVPVLDLFAHSGGIIGAEDVLGDVPAVDQQARAALPGGTALHTVLVGRGGTGKGVLVGQVGVGVNAQIGQRHGHVSVGIGVFKDVVGLRQEDVHLVVRGGGSLVQQGFIQLLLVDPVLVGVDDPVDLGAVFQGGDGAVGRGALHLGVNGFQPGAEFVVPAVDVDDGALCGSRLTAGLAGGIGSTGCAAAAGSQQACADRRSHQQGNNSFFHANTSYLVVLPWSTDSVIVTLLYRANPGGIY